MVKGLTGILTGEKFKDWLRIGRAQTYPADWLLVLIPFLHGRPDVFQGFILSVVMWFGHVLTFGHNSLLDTCIIREKGKPPPDFMDENKRHFPLVKGTISLHSAKLVIFTGLLILGIVMAWFTFTFSENKLFAILMLFLYFIFGISYNEGLSKETPFSFIPISVCFSALAGWGWLLSHSTLGFLGWLYILYACSVQLYEIGWEGNLKELSAAGKVERKNWLNVLGAYIDEEGIFHPEGATVYGVLTKLTGMLVGWIILLSFPFDITKLVWTIILTVVITYLFIKLTVTRKYIRGKELLTMSLMEVSSIFLVIPLFLSWASAETLMLIGFFYFISVNRILWKVPYPKV